MKTSIKSTAKIPASVRSGQTVLRGMSVTPMLSLENTAFFRACFLIFIEVRCNITFLIIIIIESDEMSTRDLPLPNPKYLNSLKGPAAATRKPYVVMLTCYFCSAAVPNLGIYPVFKTTQRNSKVSRHFSREYTLGINPRNEEKVV